MHVAHASDREFLDAILDAPELDEPRLRYAELLEARGDPRGELIRVQCKLATPPSDSCESMELRVREAQLLAKHGDEWEALDLPRGATPAKDIAAWRDWPRFHRGFLTAAQFCLSSDPKPLGPPPGEPRAPVCALAFVGTRYHYEGYSCGLADDPWLSRQLPCLRHVAIQDELEDQNDVPRRHLLRPLAPQLRRATNLRSLALKATGQLELNDEAPAIAQLPAGSLRALWARHYHGGWIDRLLPLPALARLSHLDLSGMCHLNEATIENVADSPCAGTIGTILLHGWHAWDRATDASPIGSRLPRLELLDLSRLGSGRELWGVRDDEIEGWKSVYGCCTRIDRIALPPLGLSRYDGPPLPGP